MFKGLNPKESYIVDKWYKMEKHASRPFSQVCSGAIDENDEPTVCFGCPHYRTCTECYSE